MKEKANKDDKKEKDDNKNKNNNNKTAEFNIDDILKKILESRK